MRSDAQLLGINHQSPLIYCFKKMASCPFAGNQSPIPFDILANIRATLTIRWESITNPL